MAEQNGLRVRRIHTEAKAWDFKSRAAFLAFGSVTFVEWTRFLPEAERQDFVTDVLDRYQSVAADQPGEEKYLQVLSDGYHACARLKSAHEIKIIKRHLAPPLEKGVEGILKTNVDQLVSCMFLRNEHEIT